MLNRATKKSKAFGVEIELINADLHDVSYDDAKLILSNYTLQFIRPCKEKISKKKFMIHYKKKGFYI